MAQETTTAVLNGAVSGSRQTSFAVPRSHYVMPSTTLVDARDVSSRTRQAMQAASNVELFDRLSPLERFKFLLKHDRRKAAMLVCALLIGLNLTALSVAHLGPSVVAFLSISALADTLAPAGVGQASESFQWYIGGLLGMALLFALGVWAVAESKKSNQGFELVKQFTGFGIGFLAGKAKLG